MVTGFYTAIIALLTIFLSFRVIALRGGPLKSVLGFQHAGDETLKRAIRAHGNLIEYAPIFLIMMFLAEYQGLPEKSLHGVGVVFLTGRLLHGYCFAFARQNMLMRTGGMLFTFISMLALVIWLLWFGSSY